MVCSGKSTVNGQCQDDSINSNWIRIQDNPGEPATENITLNPYLCGSYTISLANFLHLLQPVQKISSGTGSPGQSQKKGRKLVERVLQPVAQHGHRRRKIHKYVYNVNVTQELSMHNSHLIGRY